MDVQFILSKIKQFPVAVGSVVLAILLLVGWYVRGRGLPEMQATMEELEKEVRLIRANADQATGLEDDLTALQELVGQIDDRLMVREERAINVQYFYNFDLEEGLVDIISVNQMAVQGGGPGRGAPGQPGAPTNYELITFSAQAQGTWDEVLQLLYRLRNGDKIMRISSFSMTPKGTVGPDADILIVDLRIEAVGRLPDAN